MLAVIPVRDGILPAGALEVTAECGGRAHAVGSQPTAAGLDEVAIEVRLTELGPFAPGRWAEELAPLLAGEAVIVLPASPDGRDLAPRLAHQLDRPLHAGAVEVTPDAVRLSRAGGLELHDVRPETAFVATLQPGVRGVEPRAAGSECFVRDIRAGNTPTAGNTRIEATVVEVLPPDVATMDLAEAAVIVGGGAGLSSAARFAQLAAFAASIGGAMGATRVITDRGWVGHERQIGTTGVVVDPDLYLALGISGAVQHTSGLGRPTHIVSVNTDPHCPMMQLADLAIVSDANAVLDELIAAVSEPAGARP